MGARGVHKDDLFYPRAKIRADSGWNTAINELLPPAFENEVAREKIEITSRLIWALGAMQEIVRLHNRRS